MLITTNSVRATTGRLPAPYDRDNFDVAQPDMGCPDCQACNIVGTDGATPPLYVLIDTSGLRPRQRNTPFCADHGYLNRAAAIAYYTEALHLAIVCDQALDMPELTALWQRVLHRGVLMGMDMMTQTPTGGLVEAVLELRGELAEPARAERRACAPTSAQARAEAEFLRGTEFVARLIPA